MEHILPYVAPDIVDGYDANNIPDINLKVLFQTYLVYCSFWQVCYMFFEHVIIRGCFANRNEKLSGMGRSYLASTLNAMCCTSCGIYIFMSMKDETVSCKYFFINCSDASLLNFTLVTGANISAHFTLDLIGILFTYPRDKKETNSAIAIHHLIFLTCGIIGSIFYLTPFTYSWLNLCEISTIPLNIRWFAINTGNGNSTLYWMASYSFVLSFVIFRIVVYGIGLLDVYLKYDGIKESMEALREHKMKTNGTLGVLALVFLGWLLQLYWLFTGILPLLFRRGGKKRGKEQ